MRGRAAFSWINWIDQPGVIFATDNEAADARLSNLARPGVADPWRATGLAASSGALEAEIIFDRPRAAASIGCLALLLADRRDDSTAVDYVPEMAPSDTVRWLLTSDGGATGDAYDSGALASGILPTIGYHAILPAAGAITAPVKKVKLVFSLSSRTTAPEDFVTIGRAWVGNLRRMKVNFSPRFSRRWMRDSLGHTVRQFKASFERVKDDIGEADEILAMQQGVVDRRQILFFWDTLRPQEAILGKLTTLEDLTGAFSNNNVFPFNVSEDWLGL